MIREFTMWEAICDGCGTCARTQISESFIIDIVLNRCGWKEIDGKLYCPDCYEYDGETDDYKPKKKEA